MEKIFRKGIEWESNTYYRADQSRYDIYPEDCTVTNNSVYFSYSPAPPETMHVGFLIKDRENITVDFCNATLVFHGRIAPFILDHCKNVRFINFKVDYERPFYTQAHVLECSPTRIKMRIDDGFAYKVEDGYLYAVSDRWEKKLNQGDCLLWMFDRSGKKNYRIILGLFGHEIFPWENPPMPVNQILVEEEGDCLILHGEFPEKWDVNDGNNSLVFTHEKRDKCTVTMVNSEDIYIENFTLIYGAAYAIMGMNCKNIYLENYNTYIDYEGNGRLVTNNADAVHLFNCKGNFVLKNSHMEGMLDDTVNIHSSYFRVVKAEGNSLTCKFTGKSLRHNCPLFAAGDDIAIYCGRTQERRAEYHINDVTLLPESGAVVFSLDQEVIGAEEGDVIENLSGSPTILIENCEFNRFRGTMRLQSRNKTVIRNCKFNNKDCSVLFSGDMTYWFESGPVNDYLIENCVFRHTSNSVRLQFHSGVEYTEKEKYYHKNITVRNCYFDAGIIAALDHVDNFVFENNTSDGEMIIKAANCGTIICDESVALQKA